MRKKSSIMCPCCNKSLIVSTYSVGQLKHPAPLRKTGGWCEWSDCTVEDGRITEWPTVLVVPKGFLSADEGVYLGPRIVHIVPRDPRESYWDIDAIWNGDPPDGFLHTDTGEASHE